MSTLAAESPARRPGAEPPAGGAATHEPAPARKGLVLAVCCVAQFMVILDLSIVNVALPSIQDSLRFSSADLQWVIDAYAIIFAGFLMLAGRAGDLFGQRRTFGASLLVFALASLIGGTAPTSGVLIFARGLQGLGGAGMAASSLAIITATFAAGAERHRAIAWWGAMNGVGGAAGVLFGGVITDALSWRWVLLVNVPIGIAAAVIAGGVVANVQRRRAGFDLPGALVLTIGLLVATYGGVTAGSDGWASASALVPIAVGSALLTLFPLVERRVADPLVPPGALTARLRLVNFIVLLFSAAIFPMWYVGSLYLQQVLDLSPLQTGLVFLPMALTIFACASQAGKLAIRAGVRPVLGGGLVLMAVGMALLARIGPGGSALEYVMLPGVLTAMGIGFSIVPSTIAATQSAAADQAGLTSGVVNTARQVGGGLGLAILISIATQHTSHLIGGGTQVSHALTSGFRLAYLIGAGLVVVAAALTFAFVGSAGEAPGRATAVRRLAFAGAAVLAAFVAVDLAIPRSHAAPIGHYTTRDTLSFVTEPGLHPPRMQLLTPPPRGHALPGLILTTNFYDLSKPPMVGQSGPMILDGDLQPVWFHPVPKNVVAANLEAQTYRGRPVLTWWQGDVTATGQINSGEDVVVDDHYRPIARLRGRDGWVLTMHSMVIQGGAAWVTANRNVQTNLSRLGGVGNGVLVDSAVQKYDLRTGRLLSTWRASDHIPLSDSHTQPPANGFPWDAYHVNSVNLAPGGRIVVSMRNTWAAYLIDPATGRVEWQLGGRHSSFRLPDDAQFEWQHDVAMRSPSVVSLFDNHCCQITGAGQYLEAKAPSRGLVLRLDTARHTASRVVEYSHGSTFRSQYMGNVEEMPDGDVFVGWGQVPYLSAYTRSGRLLFDGAFPAPDISYRAYVQRWTGRPAAAPRAAIVRRGGTTTVYASWNGATRLAAWRVVAPDGGARPATVAQRRRSGFETAIRVPGAPARLQVQALDAGGRVLATANATQSERQNGANG